MDSGSKGDYETISMHGIPESFKVGLPVETYHCLQARRAEIGNLC